MPWGAILYSGMDWSGVEGMHVVYIVLIYIYIHTHTRHSAENQGFLGCPRHSGFQKSLLLKVHDPCVLGGCKKLKVFDISRIAGFWTYEFHSSIQKTWNELD